MAPNTDNLTAVLHKIEDLRLENRPVPQPKPNEVLLRMGCVGICGSDVHYYVRGCCAGFVVRKPTVMGHEGSGVVEKVGSEVKSLKPGDRVAIEPGVPCMKCNYCKIGKYNLCRDIFFCATPPDDGNLCRYYTHAADFCHKLPDNVSLEEGALMEPLAVGVYACKQADVRYGDTVLITGCGPIGLVSLVAAKAMGAVKVVMTDINAHRIGIAKNAGADAVINVGQGTVEDHVKQIEDYLDGELPTVTLDCTGFEASINLCVQATQSGGRFVLVGMATSGNVQLPLPACLNREITMKGVFRYANAFPTAISMVATGKINVKQFITHNFKLEEAKEAFLTAKTGKGNPIKVMIHCQEKQ